MATYNTSADQLPRRLVSAINEGNCIAFVGAGFSRPAELPDWKSLLSELSQKANPNLRKYLRRRLSDKSSDVFEEVAQALEDELGQARLEKLLQSRLTAHDIPTEMKKRLRWLNGIPFRAILTTNFDTLIPGRAPEPKTYRKILRAPRRRWWDDWFWRQNAHRPPTLKLHGDVNHSNSVVFTRRSYRRRLHSDPHFTRFLGSVFAQHTVLYLGFSFSDAYLNELRSEALALLGHDGGDHPIAFTISNDVPPRTQEYLEQHEGICAISYSSHGNKDFSGFNQLLRSLYESTSPIFHFGRILKNRRILWLDKKPENNALVEQFFIKAREEAGLSTSSMRPKQVRTVEEAVNALQLASQNKKQFDLVITHWGVPDSKDAVAERLLNAMRSHDLRSPVLIFSTNSHAEERRRRALALGAYEYCWTFGGLLRAIDRVLGSGIEHEL